MRKRMITMAAAVLVSGLSVPSRAGTKDFERLKALVGEWEGEYEWTGTSSRGPMTATYSLGGNGSALVENLSQEGRVTMTSVYHLDGEDLRVTHFCAAGNQPRLKASHESSANGVLEFDMIDITNLQSPDAAHVDHIELAPEGPDGLTIRFRTRAKDAERYEIVRLHRVARHRGPSGAS